MNKKIIFLVLIAVFFILALNLQCIAKINFNEKKIVTVPAGCTTLGELNCPKGFKASCPKQYKPSCVFVGTMHLPACLADSADDTFYSFDLNKITCEKK